MWREWGRSIDLGDSTTRGRQLVDAALLVLVQALPLPLLVAMAAGLATAGSRVLMDVLLSVNAALMLIRVLLLGALVKSYQRPGVSFWLSPLADVAAVARVLWSTVVRPRTWRGRTYA